MLLECQVRHLELYGRMARSDHEEMREITTISTICDILHVGFNAGTLPPPSKPK